MDLPKRTRQRIARGLCGHCVSHYQHRFGQNVHRQEIGSIQNHTLSHAHTQKNGKKVRKKIRGAVASDWQDYYGSSDALAKDIERLGRDRFRREILYYCRSKAECNYIEAREQFSRRVLESDRYYNGHIRVRVHGSLIINETIQNENKTDR